MFHSSDNSIGNDEAGHRSSNDDKESENCSEVGFWEESMCSVDRRNSTREWGDEIFVEDTDSTQSKSSLRHDVGGEKESTCHGLSDSFPEMAATKRSHLPVADASPRKNSKSLTCAETPSPIDVARQSPQEHELYSSGFKSISTDVETREAKVLTPPSTIPRSNSFGGFSSFPLFSETEILPNTNGDGDKAFESHFLYFVYQLVKEKINTVANRRPPEQITIH